MVSSHFIQTSRATHAKPKSPIDGCETKQDLQASHAISCSFGLEFRVNEHARELGSIHISMVPLEERGASFPETI